MGFGVWPCDSNGTLFDRMDQVDDLIWSSRFGFMGKWEKTLLYTWKKIYLLLGTTDFFHIKIYTWQHFSDGQSVLTKYLDISFRTSKNIRNGFWTFEWFFGRTDEQNQNFHVRVRCHLYDNSVNGFNISHFSKKKSSKIYANISDPKIHLNSWNL